MKAVSFPTRRHYRGLFYPGIVLLFCLSILCCTDDGSDDPQPTPTATPTPVPNTPPETTITDCPEVVTTFPFSISYIGEDAEDTVTTLTYAYRMNGGSWSSWSSETTATFSGFENDDYLFEVKARDSEGLEDASPASCQVTVDIYYDEDAPETWIVSGPSDTIFVNEAIFVYRGSDNDTATENLVYSWQFDNGDWTDYDPATEAVLSNLSEGTHYFAVRARDEVGNVDATPDTRTFIVNLSYYGISLQPYSASLTVLPGAEAVFPVTVTNTGTLAGSFTFSLDLQLPPTWFANFCLSDGTCIVDEITLQYAPGVTDTMTIHILTDAASYFGTEGFATLTAVCQEDPSVIGYCYTRAVLGP